MKQKENIFEELNKMKRLINAKAGTVISEQNISTDIDTIVKNIGSLSLSSENEKAVVNTIINNSKTKQDFENLLSQFKSKTGKDLATELPKVLQPGRDPNEISQLKNHLSKIGITMSDTKRDGKWAGFSFGGLDTAASSGTANTDELWKNPKVSCVTTQPGVKGSKIGDGSTAYFLNGVTYYNNGRKRLSDKTVANYSCSTEFKSGNNKSNDYARIVNDYSKQIQSSLGSSPTGKMSSQDLDLILKTLNGEDVSVEVPQELPKDVNGKPDLDKILASLQN